MSIEIIAGGVIIHFNNLGYRMYLRTYCVKKKSARKPTATIANVVDLRRLQNKIKK